MMATLDAVRSEWHNAYKELLINEETEKELNNDKQVFISFIIKQIRMFLNKIV